jgi:hypothetical protein
VRNIFTEGKSQTRRDRPAAFNTTPVARATTTLRASTRGHPVLGLLRRSSVHTANHVCRVLDPLDLHRGVADLYVLRFLDIGRARLIGPGIRLQLSDLRAFGLRVWIAAPGNLISGSRPTCLITCAPLRLLPGRRTASLLGRLRALGAAPRLALLPLRATAPPWRSSGLLLATTGLSALLATDPTVANVFVPGDLEFAEHALLVLLFRRLCRTVEQHRIWQDPA